jgi:hypothetical protein
MDSNQLNHRICRWVTAPILCAAALLVGCDRENDPTSPTPRTPAEMQFDVTNLETGDDPTLPSADYVLQRDVYDLVDEPFDPVVASNSPPGSNSTLLWGYEASFGNSRILSYNIGPPVTPGPNCVPDAAAGGPTGNGRGVAYDPLDGNLWISRLTGFTGDGFIHKVTPPQVTPGVCPQVDVIPFGDGPGGMIQDDIGALDLDQASKHIWAAGYAPVSVAGGPPSQYYYLVNRNNGKILQSCFTLVDPTNAEGFNDSFTYARLKGLPGSGQYLLTDNGEFFGRRLKAIDTASCHDAKEATIVAEFTISHGMTGLDFEWPGLLSTNLFTLFNDGDQPFATSTPLGSMAPSGTVEDISLCGYRAKFGGDGNDGCRYQI